MLRGDSVIDWHRLNFATLDEVHDFLAVHEFLVDDPGDQQRLERVKSEAIDYLRRHFDFPVPKPIERLGVDELMLLGSSRGHRQLCACTILKCMHIIHHLEGRELLFMLPLSDQEVFQMVEEKVYRVVGGMLAAGMPITEFMGGRKNKYSLYTKLLAKDRGIATQIYDKLRFRVVTRSRDDILPVVHYLTQKLFPFNYVIPLESTSTIFDFDALCMQDEHLSKLVADPQFNAVNSETWNPGLNVFTDEGFKVIHFVTDMPLRVSRDILDRAPPAAAALGPVIFSLVEFQIIDRDTEASNEIGDASHERYKERQRLAVMRRLKLGARGEGLPKRFDPLIEEVPLPTVPPPTSQPPPPLRQSQPPPRISQPPPPRLSQPPPSIRITQPPPPRLSQPPPPPKPSRGGASTPLRKERRS